MYLLNLSDFECNKALFHGYMRDLYKNTLF